MLQKAQMAVSFPRAMKRGVLTLFREEGWGTALGSLLGVVVLVQIVLLLIIGVEGGLTLLRRQTDLRLQIRDGATDAQVQDLVQNIRQLPIIDDVVYITREQALERQKKRDPALVDFLTKFGIDNPFPDTLGVRLKRLSDYNDFATFLKQPVFSPVVDPAFLSETTDQQQQVERMADVVSAVRTTLFFIAAIVAAALLFVIIELVRRRALMKREELFVEQLVGASRLATLLPFGIGMTVLLGLATFLSLALVGGTVALLPVLVPALAAGGIFGPWMSLAIAILLAWSPWIILSELLSVVVLSALGTLLAFRPTSTISLLSSPDII